MDPRGILEHLASYGTAGPSVARAIDVGSGPYLEYFEHELLEGFVELGGATCRLYEGEYGGGKTHLLQLLEDVALGRGSAVVRADLSQDLHLSDWQGLVQHVLSNIRVRDATGHFYRGVPDILDALQWPDGAEASLKGLRTPHPGLRDAIHLAAFAGSSTGSRPSLRRYLLGESVKVSELKREGTKGVKGPLTKRNAERVLQTLGMSLRELGLSSLVLLFDETEHMLARSRAHKDVVAANLLRRLIDGSTSGHFTATFIGFAVLPGTVEQASLIYPALGQRLRVLERDGGAFSGFRRPVLEIGQMGSCLTADAFLDGAVAKISSLAGQAGVRRPGLVEDLRTEGQAVIQGLASGYRRPLFKQLASCALRGE
jgi:hypothetical protein